MHSILMLFLTLGPNQEALPDSQTLLAELRALRVDLRNTAATIQRVQIVMYRLQAQAGVLWKATERMDNARAQCKQAQEQQKAAGAQIEQMKKQNSQNAEDRKNIEQVIAQLEANTEMWASQSQQCQGEQADAEAQVSNGTGEDERA